MVALLKNSLLYPSKSFYEIKMNILYKIYTGTSSATLALAAGYTSPSL